MRSQEGDRLSRSEYTDRLIASAICGAITSKLFDFFLKPTIDKTTPLPDLLSGFFLSAVFIVIIVKGGSACLEVMDVLTSWKRFRKVAFMSR